ncbi:hypothetical protein XH97_11475 [Bradyrhizobium sp. CCBAU 53380]|nr:hypothetical protein [Bradyrhizobium sp. CCBAU 53380]
MRRAGNPFRAVVARPAGEDDARSIGQLQEDLQQLPARVVGPLPVVDHQHRRPLRRQDGKESEQVTDHAVDGHPAAARIGAGRRQREDRFSTRPELGGPWLQACAGNLVGLDDRCVRPDSQVGAQHLQEWLQDLGTGIAFAAAPQQLEGLGTTVLQHFFQEPRLPEPGTADDDHATLPGRMCLAEKTGQKVESLVATNKGRQAATRSCLESAGRRASSQHHARLRHSGRCTRCLKAVAELEEICMRTEGIDAGEDLPRRSVARQVRRRVHDIADQVVSAGLDISLGQEQGAGVDGGMHLQRHESRRHAIMAQLPNPLVDIECRLRGATTVVLARLGIAEHGEGTVSLRSDDATAVPGDRAMPNLPQLAQELGKVLGFDIST